MYVKIRSHFQWSRLVISFGKKHKEEEKLSFFGIVQVYIGKIATTLLPNAIVAYPVDVMLSDFSEMFCRFLMNHRHLFVGLLPVWSTTDEQNEQEENFENSFEVERPFVPLYDALPVNMRKLQQIRSL